MSNIKKSAVRDLIIGVVSFFVMLLCFAIFHAFNTKGIEYVFIFVLGGSLVGIAIWLSRNKFAEAKFDEREREIDRTAFKWSMYIMMGFLLIVCFCPFFIIGGQGEIPVIVLPLIFMFGVLIAQLTACSVKVFMAGSE